MFRVISVAFATSLVVLAASCSNIRFERGPYAIRHLEVVYSEQEDTTFLSWRLRKDAKLRRVSFELLQDGEFVPVDLGKAPFPAEPYTCHQNFWCFQFQVPGRYRYPDDTAPVRSVHDSEGVFAGPDPKVQTVARTLDVDPHALGHNESIDPGLWDWFADQDDVDLKRNFEWQMTDVGPDGPLTDAAGCLSPTADAWGALSGNIRLGHDWVKGEFGKCVHVRPIRRGDDGVDLVGYLLPAAETTFEHQRYVPPKETSPIAYGILLDMEIPSESRCKQVKDWLLNTIAAQFEQRGHADRLGVYTPVSSETGDPLGGCEQSPTADYPIAQMIQDAKAVETQYAPRNVRVLWIYVNNVELPPSERVLGEFVEFGQKFVVETNLQLYTWAIGSNAVLQMFGWDDTTGWRPIEDKTFKADIKSFARNTLPFATMLHQSDTEVSIDLPDGVEHPKYFKVCQSTPIPYDFVGTVPGQPRYDRASPAVAWPDGDHLPYYTLTLEPQVLVPKAAYVRRRIDVVVEVCERFCNGPFRTRGGDDYRNWRNPAVSNPMEVCQWSL